MANCVLFNYSRKLKLFFNEPKFYHLDIQGRNWAALKDHCMHVSFLLGYFHFPIFQAISQNIKFVKVKSSGVRAEQLEENASTSERQNKKQPISRMVKGVYFQGGCFPKRSQNVLSLGSVWGMWPGSRVFYLLLFNHLNFWGSKRLQPHPITTSHSDGLDSHFLEENIIWVNWLFQGNPALLSSKGRWERMATPLRWTWSSRTTVAPPSGTTWSSTERWVLPPPQSPLPLHPNTHLVGATTHKAQAGAGVGGAVTLCLGSWSGF